MADLLVEDGGNTRIYDRQASSPKFNDPKANSQTAQDSLTHPRISLA